MLAVHNAVKAADGAACARQMIKWKQEGMHLPNFGMDLSNPDFVKLAESMGASGHKVSSVCKSCSRFQGSFSSRRAWACVGTMHWFHLLVVFSGL